MQVETQINEYFRKIKVLSNIFIYEENEIVMGFAEINIDEPLKLHVDPCLLGNGIGLKLIDFAVSKFNVSFLWILENNKKATSFYHRHDFYKNGERKKDVTKEFLIKLVKEKFE